MTALLVIAMHKCLAQTHSKGVLQFCEEQQGRMAKQFFIIPSNYNHYLNFKGYYKTSILS